MTKITIDNQEYELESLSENAKAQLQSIRYVDTELGRLEAQAAVFKTARAGYVAALKADPSLSSGNGGISHQPESPVVTETPFTFPDDSIPASGWKGFFKK